MKTSLALLIALSLFGMATGAFATTITGDDAKTMMSLLEKSGHKPDSPNVPQTISFPEIETCSIRAHVDPPGQSPGYLCMTWDPVSSVRSYDLGGDDAQALTNLMISAGVCQKGDSDYSSYSVRNLACTQLETGYAVCTFEAGMLVTSNGTVESIWKSCE